MKNVYWLALLLVVIVFAYAPRVDSQSTPSGVGRYQLVTGPIPRSTFIIDTTGANGPWVACNAPDGTVSFCFVPVTSFTAISPLGDAKSPALPMRGPATEEKRGLNQ